MELLGLESCLFLVVFVLFTGSGELGEPWETSPVMSSCSKNSDEKNYSNNVYSTLYLPLPCGFSNVKPFL